MIKPWILNMTKSLKPQKTISNLITRFMFNSGLCEYTPSHQRFNHRWFRGSSTQCIQKTPITWITWCYFGNRLLFFFKFRTSIGFQYLVWKQDFYQTAFWKEMAQWFFFSLLGTHWLVISIAYELGSNNQEK